MPLPLWRLTTLRRKLFEAIGLKTYSRPAFGKIQTQLAKYFSGPGFFIEAGAVDGFFESNTYYLETFLGWKGILIEPVPEMFKRLATNRPKSTHFHCALVSKEFAGDSIPINPAHAMSRIADSTDPSNSNQTVNVPVKTLSSILNEVNAATIDLLSLDVEGYETEALRGLDFTQHKPRYILVECLEESSKTSIHELLGGEYECVEQMSHRDWLFRDRNLN